MEEMQNQEIVKEVVEEFSRIQQWMLLADRDSAVYEAIRIRYYDLKVILASLNVNVAELDRVKC